MPRITHAITMQSQQVNCILWQVRRLIWLSVASKLHNVGRHVALSSSPTVHRYTVTHTVVKSSSACIQYVVFGSHRVFCSIKFHVSHNGGHPHVTAHNQCSKYYRYHLIKLSKTYKNALYTCNGWQDISIFLAHHSCQTPSNATMPHHFPKF